MKKLLVELEFNESWERWTTELPEKAIEMVMAGNHEGVKISMVTPKEITLKTELYIAKGSSNGGMSILLDDCDKLCEIDGMLYNYDSNIVKMVIQQNSLNYKRRVVMSQKDYITANGIVRKIVLSV